MCYKFMATGGKNFGKILIRIRWMKSLWRVFPWQFYLHFKFSRVCIANPISWQFIPVDQFWVLPCQGHVQRLPRPSQSMHFGAVSKMNGWEMPTKLARTTWPETHRPRTIMRLRDEAKFSLLLYSQPTHIWEYYNIIMQNDPWRTNTRKENVI